MLIEDHIFSISEYIDTINSALRAIEAKITGEIVEIKTRNSPHKYFTIKDKNENAVIECVMWASVYRANGVFLEKGMEVILSGSASIYKPSGFFSFIANTVEIVGEGKLKAEYDKLKKKLELEGLFRPERKQKLPLFPTNIGVITSKQGAVIHDFTNNLSKHGYKIYFVNSRVEGKEALFDLLQAIKILQKQPIELLVIMRGGGSIQSFQAFDNETIVRTITNLSIPVISAVGHHQDVPLLSLAADVSVSTPTAAANIISQAYQNANASLDQYQAKIYDKYTQNINSAKLSIQRKINIIEEKYNQIFKQFDHASQDINVYLVKINSRLQSHHQYFNSTFASIQKSFLTSCLTYKNQLKDSLTKYDYETSIITTKNDLDRIWSNQIIKSFMFCLQTKTDKLTQIERVIDLNDPIRLLKNGYSIVRAGNKVVKSRKNVTIGQNIDVLISDGRIISEVKKTIAKI